MSGKTPESRFRNDLIAVQKTALGLVNGRDAYVVGKVQAVNKSLGRITGFSDAYASTRTPVVKELAEAWRRTFISYLQMLYSGAQLNCKEALILAEALDNHMHLFSMRAKLDRTLADHMSGIVQRLNLCAHECQPYRHSELFARNMYTVQLMAWRLHQTFNPEELRMFERFDAWLGCFTNHIVSQEEEFGDVQATPARLKSCCEAAVVRMAVCTSFGWELPKTEEIDGEKLFAQVLEGIEYLFNIKLDLSPTVLNTPRGFTPKAPRV